MTRCDKYGQFKTAHIQVTQIIVRIDQIYKLMMSNEHILIELEHLNILTTS